MFKSKNINFIASKPFFIFEIKNFLNQNLYNNLNKNFPFRENHLKNLTDFKNGKFAFDTTTKIYKDLLQTNIYVKQLHELVYSKKFFNFFYKKLFFKFISSRKNSKKHLLKLIRPPKLVSEINKDSIDYYLNIFTKIKIEIQYSYIKNLGKIVPHTDSGEKLLSLMLYFPDYEDKKNIELKKKEKNYGTIFWDSNFSNFNNLHQEGINELNFTEDINNKILYKTEFLGNNLQGFIKNPYSWHSVEPQNVIENYVRKSININFYF